MRDTMYPVIDLNATGQNILRLRKARGLTVRDMQRYFGFDEPQAIYKWQSGKSLPTVDNLYALSALLDIPMEDILVRAAQPHNIVSIGQRTESGCPVFFFWSCASVAARRAHKPPRNLHMPSSQLYIS